jgi:hypothetical protein
LNIYFLTFICLILNLQGCKYESIEYIKLLDQDTVKRYFTYIILEDILDNYSYYEFPGRIINNFNNFNLYIEFLIKKINRIKTKRNIQKLIIVAPGDTPSKIIKFVKKLNLCPECEFISFPASGIKQTYDEEKEKRKYEYIKNFLPDDIESVVLFDYIFSGSGLNSLINIYEKKFNDIHIDKSEIITRMRQDVISRGGLYIIPINISNHFNEAETYNLRCVQSYETYEKKDLILNYNLTRCELFVYAYIIYYLKKDVVNKLLNSKEFNNELNHLQNNEYYKKRRESRNILKPKWQ